MNRLALVILAAGNSKRFGGIKQLAAIEGKLMLQQVIDQCSNFERADLFIVLGAHREEILSRIELRNGRLLDSPNWSDGVGATIASVVDELKSAYEGILFMAGDQPYVRRDHLSDLIGKWYEDPARICCAEYGGSRGIPAIFPKSTYSELLDLKGDQGAKHLLFSDHGLVEAIEIPEAAEDIDHPSQIGGALH